MIINGHINESRKVSLDSLSLEGAATRLYEAAEGLTNVRFYVELGWEYGEPCVNQYIVGSRPATADEIAEQEAKTDQAATSVRERQEQDLARLKQQRPDLF